jgi:hypothetical protein
VGGLLLGELESQQLVGDQLVQGGGHSGCEDQALHLSGFLVLRVQDWLRQLLQLLYAAQVCGPVTADKIGINLLDGLFGQVNGEHLLDAGQAHRSLQAADCNEIGQMNPAIALFHRGREELQPDIIVHCAGCQDGVLGRRMGL